jgi:sarcosine oxidase, subunit beta
VSTFDLIIVGAGITGLSSGYWLARQGARVLILDKGRVAYEASSRAVGFQSLRGENPPEIPLAAAANELWHTLDEQLGYPTEWSPSGRLWVALSDREYADFSRTATLWQAQSLPVRLIDAAEVRELIPAVTDRVVGGLYTKRGGHANPQRTSQAFAWAFLDQGGTIHEQTPVLGVEMKGGRVVGVRTPDGLIAAGAVIICAGPQAALLARPLGIEWPIVTARVEACVTAPIANLFDMAIVANGLSIRQTRRGNILYCGGPHEWVDVDLTSEPAKPATPVMQGEARRAVELLPVLENTPLLRTWGGIVEVSPDHACIVERVTAPERLIIATASGHGIGLAPAMGKVISELAISGTTTIPIDGLSLSRFRDLPPNWAAERHWVAGQYNT